MKTNLILSFLLVCTYYLSAQNVGIGTNTPNASAQLDVSSTSKGMLAPRMNTAQRTAIASPVKGLLVYDTDLNALYHYNGSSWSSVGGGGGFTIPYEGTLNSANPGIKITNSGFGPAIQAITTNEFGYALQASTTANYGYSIYAYSRSPNGIGVYAFVDSSIGVKGESGKGIGVDAISTDSSALRARIMKGANADPVILATHAGVGIAVDASSATGAAVRGTSANTSGAIIGTNTNVGTGVGVYGGASGSSGQGVRGESQNGVGVLGYSNNGTGVSGGTLGGTALYGNSISGYSLDISGKVKISGGNTSPGAGKVLTSVDASGNAIWQQPVAAPKIAFRMQGASTTSTSGTANNSFSHNTYKKVEFQSKDYDLGNNGIVTGNGVATSVSSTYIIPQTGLYHFDAGVTFELNYVFNYVRHRIRLMLNRNGSISSLCEVTCSLDSQTDGSPILSIDRMLQADDIVWIEAQQNNSSLTPASIYTENHRAFFCGHLVFTQ